MRYRVRGISVSTGVEATLVIEAKHHEAAEAIARRQMIVSEVVPEGGLAEPEIFDRLAADRVEPTPLAPAPREPQHSDTSPKLRPSHLSRTAWAVAFLVVLGLLIGLLIWFHRR